MYLNLLKRAPKCIDERNSVAHETEADFARLLLQPEFYEREHYYRWRGLFPFTYGGTIVTATTGPVGTVEGAAAARMRRVAQRRRRVKRGLAQRRH
ncbi:MAG: hypothetical protein M1826_004315 [Phylliscum demangeonii]|nr:MAG: hypothetical protein M1826_004315 [Phylliscum demangeonii]